MFVSGTVGDNKPGLAGTGAAGGGAERAGSNQPAGGVTETVLSDRIWTSWSQDFTPGGSGQ